MVEDTLLPFSLPSVQRKKVTAAFDGGRITSDGGVMLLAAIETSMGIAAKLAPLINRPAQSAAGDTWRRRYSARPHARHRLRLRGCRRPRPPAPRSRVQAGLWTPAERGRRAVFATDGVALGERAEPA